MQSFDAASLAGLDDSRSTSRHDKVVQLREWGTSRAFVLPSSPDAPLTLGASPTCTLQLRDPSDRLSQIHATLSFEDGRWVLRDTPSKGGIRFDGLHKPEIALEGGLEIGIGGISLVAESARTVELRAYLCRLLGWDDARQATVELGLRSLRLWAARRVALVVEGEDDLIAIARSLHDRAGDRRQPFVVCDPRRRRGTARSKAPTNYEDAMEAVHAAAGGSLCVLARRLPSRFGDARPHLEQPSARTALVICGSLPPSLRDLANVTLQIPRLSTRIQEFDRIVDSCAAEAAAGLGVGDRFTKSDRDWIRARSAGSLGEIAKGTRRLVALRVAGNVTRAAALLGMSHASLGEWLGRRRGVSRSCQTLQFATPLQESTHRSPGIE